MFKWFSRKRGQAPKNEAEIYEALKMSVLTPGPLKTKVRTSFLSLAICDALGGPVQFKTRGSFPKVTKMIANDHFHLGPGHWSDDTSMALCIGASIIETGKFDVLDQSKKYGDWVQNGYMSSTKHAFDVGMGTNFGVSIMIKSGFTEAGLEDCRKSMNKASFSGNGSLMRVLPIALGFFHEGQDKAMDYAKKSSLPTHPNDVCQEACAVYTLLVCRILEETRKKNWNFSKGELLDILNAYPYETDKIAEVVGPASKFLQKTEDEIRSSGYVVHTLQCALWIFFTTDSFEEGALKIVNLGDDADSTAAVYGGLAGAWYADVDVEEAKGGKESKFWSKDVQDWYDALAKRDTVERIAMKLAILPRQ